MDTKYQYIILPSKPLFNEEVVPLHNKVYSKWRDLWNGVFGANGFKDALQRDHFVKPDKIAVIYDSEDEEVVGFHLYTFMRFDLLATIESPFFDGISEQEYALFEESGFKSGICMEYLSVDSAYRKSKTNIPFGTLLIGLGLKIMEQEGLDCVFGTARDDVKVVQMAEEFGGQCFKTGISKYDYPCSLMVIPSEDNFSKCNKSLLNQIQHLWEMRTDYTQADQLYKPQIKKVA